MMPCKIQEFIDRAVANEEAAWEGLWRIIEEATLRPVQHVLRWKHRDTALAGDVLQELYLYLQRDHLHYLKNFKGEDEVQFPGPTHHRFSRIPSPRRISSRKSGSKAAAKRFLAMLNLAG